ncbi:Peptidyl-prolyl cis-trans isomerase [Granulicella sibirica]|uniref:Peptidyl-prolyl cis-trans isomerase n=2 Tax=Granulicella sibirica TaxID=2479048 RepID=A0A4Q0T619_9BACT|nr:Peptidyl-prolyl cis-trans isomerase [Granulicella sibirica]
MSKEQAPALASDPPDTIDRVIAIVNGDLILESDVDEEHRFAAFQPFSTPDRDFSRDQAIQRLINRTLILQQAKLQVTDEVKAVDVTKQIDTLRQEIPECKVDKCDTEEGWNKFLAKQGFTAAELQQRWKERMQVLAYIENRFRMGIRIKPEEIKQYYDTVMLPEYKRHKSTAPKLEDISARIQEILLQQRVGQLLQDWLKSLRAQGTVQIMKPGEVAP